MNINRISFLLCILISLLASSCSKDEPNDSQKDFSEFPNLETILPGVWVAVSEEGSLYRYEFGLDGAYASIFQVSLNDNDQSVKVGGGSYTLDGKRREVTLKPKVLGAEKTTLLSLARWSTNEFGLNVVTSEGKSQRVFHKVIASYMLKPEETVILNDNFPVGVDVVRNGSVVAGNAVSFDSSTTTITAKSNGVGYISIPTENGTGYIEVVVTSITGMPYDFSSLINDYFDRVLQTLMDAFHLSSELELKESPVEGIECIRIITKSTNSFSWVGRFEIDFSDNCPPLGIWRLITTEYSLIIPSKKFTTKGMINTPILSDSHKDLLKKEAVFWNVSHEVMIGDFD